MSRLSAAVAIAALGVVAAVATAPYLYPRLETAALWYDVIGVDVSSHQGSIDWGALKAGGVGFAFIKATEGGDFRDRAFQRNWQDAAAAGIPRGAYHFLTHCKSGVDQARNFIRTVPRDSAALPPALDAEDMGPCARGRSVADIHAEMVAFLNAVESHYGKPPVVYVTSEFYRAHVAGRPGADRFWVRSLLLPPAVERERWLFWQFHDRGRRRGIRGAVDLDAFRGSAGDLMAMTR